MACGLRGGVLANPYQLNYIGSSWSNPVPLEFDIMIGTVVPRHCETSFLNLAYLMCFVVSKVQIGGVGVKGTLAAIFGGYSYPEL